MKIMQIPIFLATILTISFLHGYRIKYDKESNSNINAIDIYVFRVPPKYPDMLNAMNMSKDLINLALKTGQSVSEGTVSTIFSTGSGFEAPKEDVAKKKAEEDKKKEEEAKKKAEEAKKKEETKTTSGDIPKTDIPAPPLLGFSKAKSSFGALHASEISGQLPEATTDQKKQEEEKKSDDENKKQEEEKKKKEDEKKAAEDKKKEEEAKKKDEEDKKKAEEEAKKKADEDKKKAEEALKKKGETALKVTKWAFGTLNEFSNIFSKYFLNDILIKKYTVGYHYFVPKGNLGEGARKDWVQTGVRKDHEPGLYVVIMQAVPEKSNAPGQPLWQGYMLSNALFNVRIDKDPNDSQAFIVYTKSERQDETYGHEVINETDKPYTVTVGTKGSCKNHHFDLEPNSGTELKTTPKCIPNQVVLYKYGGQRNKYNIITPPGEVNWDAKDVRVRIIIRWDERRDAPYVQVVYADKKKGAYEGIRDSRQDKSVKFQLQD